MTLKNIIPAAFLAAMMATPAVAGGHLENGKWIVTSAKREAEFYACIDNAEEMDKETETCLNNHDEEVRDGRATAATPCQIGAKAS